METPSAFEVTRRMYAALKVLTTTPAIREHLEQTDPKALRQAISAQWDYETSPNFGDWRS